MDSERHDHQMHLLVLSLKLAWKDRQDFYVGGNMAIYFSETQARRNDFRAPDVFVVLDTVRKERKSWVVWEEEGRTPDVVIELISPTTEKVDRGEKMQIYARVLQVAHFYLFDPWTGLLEGYQLDPSNSSYQPLEPDEQGRLSCRRLGLKLGIVRSSYAGPQLDWLRWIDPEGNVLPHADEVAETERQRADEMEQKLTAALAELDRLRQSDPS